MSLPTLLATGLVALANAQTTTDTTTEPPEAWEYPGAQWVIRNRERILDTWEVFELEFYWHAECINEPVNRARPVSSGNSRAFPENTMYEAVDEELETSWIAKCSVFSDGCPPGSQYIGLDVTDDR